METWVERERRTGRLVRACFATYVNARTPTADQLYAVCKLTWITKGGDDGLADNTSSVVAPALSTLVGIELSAGTPTVLSAELRSYDVDLVVARLAARPIGFTNFYRGFRNVAREWMRKNVAAVGQIMHGVAQATRDDDVRAAYAKVARLPPLPRPRAGDLPAFNLLTPALACLDPRGRAPIINSRKDVRRRLRMLGLANASLVEQYDGLRGLIGQAGLDDAFALDTADDDVIERAMRQAAQEARPPRSTYGTKPKPLGERHDEDVEFLRSADTVRMRRVHNSMTNALRTITKEAGLAIEEGSEQTCLFDALVREYAGTERHLLIEVKTDDAPPMCRMAVGQLFDYRRRLGDRAAVDLAVLFPAKPSKDALAFLGYVGAKALWFDETMSKVNGEVRLGGGK
jgi:hypothetical protein